MILRQNAADVHRDRRQIGRRGAVGVAEVLGQVVLARHEAEVAQVVPVVGAVWENVVNAQDDF